VEPDESGVTADSGPFGVSRDRAWFVVGDGERLFTTTVHTGARCEQRHGDSRKFRCRTQIVRRDAGQSSLRRVNWASVTAHERGLLRTIPLVVSRFPAVPRRSDWRVDRYATQVRVRAAVTWPVTPCTKN